MHCDRRTLFKIGAVSSTSILLRGACGWQLSAFGETPSSSRGRAYEVQFPAMGSLLHLKWLDQQSATPEAGKALAQRIRSQGIEIAEFWDGILSDYDDESDAMQLGKLADDGEWHDVKKELASVLTACDSWNRISDGAFDAALGTMTRLRRRRRLPTEKEWEEARDVSGWKWVEWDGAANRIRFKKPGVRFDFGAIGKGWVADAIYAMLVGEGIPCCSVDFSGNIRFGDAPPGTDGWPVSIDRCQEEGEEPAELCRLRLSQCGIATSGDRWQRFPDSRSRSATEKTSHIIDPLREDGIDQVQNITIIAETATAADAASTATSVRQGRDLEDWLKKLKGESPKAEWIIQSIRDGQLELVTNREGVAK